MSTIQSSVANRKAYYVSSAGSSGWGTIAFGHTEGEAKSKALFDLNDSDGEYTDMRAVRRPEYDQYAIRGRVPKKILLEDGWQFTCCTCGLTVSKTHGGSIVGDKPFCQRCEIEVSGWKGIM